MVVGRFSLSYTMTSLPMELLHKQLSQDSPAYDKLGENDAEKENSRSRSSSVGRDNGVDKNSKDYKDAENGTAKITKILAILALTCSVAFFLNGYHSVVLNAPSEVIEKWINQSYCTRHRGPEACTEQNSVRGDEKPEQNHNDSHTNDMSSGGDGVSTEKHTRFVYSLATGAFSAGGAIGSAFGGALAEHIGRRKALMATSVFMLTSSPLMGIAGFLFIPELLIIGHFLVGCSVGAGGVISTMYIVEGSPSSVRGEITMCTQLGNVAGFVSSQIVGLRVLLGAAGRWPILFLVTLFAPILQLALLLLLPDSPRYLLITRGNEEGASGALKNISGSDDISKDLRELEREKRKVDSKPHKLTYWTLVTERKYSWPLSVAVVTHLSMVWCGISVVIAYSSILLREAGLGQKASYANLAGGALYIIMTFVVVKLIDKFGRKTLHLSGLAGLIVFGLLTTLFSVAADGSSGATFARIANFASILGFVVSYAVGPASVPWLVVGELFEQESRSMATSIVVPINWLSQLAVLILFPWLLGIIKGWAFLPFVIITAVLFVFLLKLMPETKGLSFEQISEKFK